MTEDKPKVLIVDDERYNIALLVDILKDEYRTIVAKSGMEALNRARSDIPPDLILLDVMMPEMDGYEVCKRLKADVKTRDIPVIFVTALGNTDSEETGLQIGAIDYLIKPISPPIVKVRVRNHIALRHAQKTLENQNQSLKLAGERLERQNIELTEAAAFKEDVERITRHDLKTPLNAIMGIPGMMLMDSNLTEEQKEYLKMINDSAHTMLNMINLSLDLFKMERGLYTPECQPVDIVQMIRKIMKESHSIVRVKHLLWEILANRFPVGESESFMVYAEPLLCYSMLTNLIKNAAEASPKEEKIIFNLENTKITTIKINNKGAVSPEIRDRFFDKYVTHGKKRGTGLGTYSAKLIAETHGGTIELDTSVESETTVIVKLPLNE